MVDPNGANVVKLIFKFGMFMDPSDQNELYHTTLLSMDISKILDLSDRNVLVKGPFKENFDSRVARSVSQSVSLDS